MTDKKVNPIRGASAEKNHSGGADNDIRKLMVLAGRRQEPPADVRARVHASVLAAWQDQTAHAGSGARKQWRKGVGRIPWAIAASLLLALGSWALLWSPSQAPVGQLAFVSGGYSLQQAAAGAELAGSEQPTLVSYRLGDPIAPGALVQTLIDGYLKITLKQGSSLRLDHSTSVTLQNNGHLWLHKGRIYIDSPGRESQVTIVTPYASVTDVGTQFTVALIAEGVSVAVREGLVNVSVGEGQAVSAKAHNGMGEMLQVDSKQQVTRQPIATTDLSWEWIHQASADFDLSDNSLYDFLRWASREGGLELRFTSEAAELAARQTRLHGSIAGMTPLEAIQAVLATTQFVTQAGLAHELVVGFKR